MNTLQTIARTLARPFQALAKPFRRRRPADPYEVATWALLARPSHMRKHNAWRMVGQYTGTRRDAMFAAADLSTNLILEEHITGCEVYLYDYTVARLDEVTEAPDPTPAPA